MNDSVNRRQSNVLSSESSEGHTARFRYSRTSSADSIFEDLSHKANNLFAHLDEERKGYLDASVLAKACGSHLNESQMSQLAKQIDQDGDGRVSLEDSLRCLRRIAGRNSMIRASLGTRTSVTHRAVTAQGSNASTSSESTRSRLTSDDATSSEVEERNGLSKNIHRPSVAFKPSQCRERNKKRLINCLTSNAAQYRQQSLDTQHRFGVPLAELPNVDDCLGALQCQDHIYELYHLLQSENPSLSSMYQSVLVDVVDYIHRSKQMYGRLEKQIESERSEHAADMLRLSEELDQQVQMAEESARNRERELAVAEFHLQLESKTEKIEQLMERLKQIDEQNEQTPDVVQDRSLTDSRLENLRFEIRQLRLEKNRLEDLLTSTRAQLHQTRTELATVRQTFNEKSRELDNHIATFVEVVKENANLKRQVCLLQEVNRELCDANDGLCAVLENSAEEVSNHSNLREANTACALIFSNFRQLRTEYQSPPIEQARPLIATDLPEFANELRRSNSVPCDERMSENKAQINEQAGLTKLVVNAGRRRVTLMLASKQQKCQENCGFLVEPGLESLHEDSGLSSLRDAPEFESELEGDSQIGFTQFPKAYRLDHTDREPFGPDEMTGSALTNFSLFPTVKFASSPHSPLRLSPTPQPVRHQCAAPTTLNLGTTQPVAVAKPTPTYSTSTKSIVDEKMCIFRVMLAGDSDVGKSSFLIRLCDNVFTGISVSTIGIDMKMRSLEVDGRSAMLQVWDTAGQERFRSLSSSFYRKADGILLVYDCTSELSFIHIRDWINTIQRNSGREMPVAIVANKVDLREQREQQGARCVSYTAGRKLAQEIGALFYETSAATGLNVEECVTELTRLLCAQEDYNLLRPNLKLSVSTESESQKCCK
ncbi:Ras and EF-hand domain-containing protein [Fasciola hepatica]|uniref:Ras and EF-hand domain-containing protein n=1 Tax=Fasciola hepatica TaxID=6192 RepID=A0A4E0RGH2_FASHE|nr:Ras and EF-hand domain-containing protein [Fasciola hepatica]